MLMSLNIITPNNYSSNKCHKLHSKFLLMSNKLLFLNRLSNHSKLMENQVTHHSLQNQMKVINQHLKPNKFIKHNSNNNNRCSNNNSRCSSNNSNSRCLNSNNNKCPNSSNNNTWCNNNCSSNKCIKCNNSNCNNSSTCNNNKGINNNKECSSSNSSNKIINTINIDELNFSEYV